VGIGHPANGLRSAGHSVSCRWPRLPTTEYR